MTTKTAIPELIIAPRHLAPQQWGFLVHSNAIVAFKSEDGGETWNVLTHWPTILLNYADAFASFNINRLMNGPAIPKPLSTEPKAVSIVVEKEGGKTIKVF